MKNWHEKFSDHLIAIEMKKTFVKMIRPLYLGMSILDISRTLMYGFCIAFVWTILDQSMDTRQNCAIQIRIALLFTLKQKIFLKMFLMMLRDGLIHLTTMKMTKDRFQYVRIKKYQVFLKMSKEERLLQKLLPLEQKHTHT